MRRLLLARLHRAPEELHALRAAVLQDHEVGRLQVRDHVAGGVADGDGEVDLFELGRKDGRGPRAIRRRRPRGGENSRERKHDNSGIHENPAGSVPHGRGPRPRGDSTSESL